MSETTVGDDIVVIGDGDLHVSDIHTTPEGDILLTWPSTAGREYRIEKCTDLIEAAWEFVTTLTATPPDNSYVYDVGDEPCIFFRVISSKP